MIVRGAILWPSRWQSTLTTLQRAAQSQSLTVLIRAQRCWIGTWWVLKRKQIRISTLWEIQEYEILTRYKQDQSKREEVRIVCQKWDIYRRDASHGLPDGVVGQAVDVVGHALGHAGGADDVLQDEVPADGEGDELAHTDVAVHVSRAGFGHAGRELGIAETWKYTGLLGLYLYYLSVLNCVVHYW